MYLFVFAFLGNFFYVLSIVTSREALLPPPASTEFYRESLPCVVPIGAHPFHSFTPFPLVDIYLVVVVPFFSTLPS